MVDICHAVADRMKILTKLTYAAILCFGIIIGSLTIINLIEPNVLKRTNANNLVVVF